MKHDLPLPLPPQILQAIRLALLEPAKLERLPFLLPSTTCSGLLGKLANVFKLPNSDSEISAFFLKIKANICRRD